MSEETNEFLDRSDLDFVRDVLIDALDQKREDLVARLFKLYEELRAPEPTIPGVGNISITSTGFDDGSTQYDFSSVSDIEISNSFNDDVISFGGSST
jgi:hypothetical protein